jgi:hypothetical protein
MFYDTYHLVYFITDRQGRYYNSTLITPKDLRRLVREAPRQALQPGEYAPNYMVPEAAARDLLLVHDTNASGTRRAACSTHGSSTPTASTHRACAPTSSDSG